MTGTPDLTPPSRRFGDDIDINDVESVAAFCLSRSAGRTDFVERALCFAITTGRRPNEEQIGRLRTIFHRLRLGT